MSPPSTKPNAATATSPRRDQAPSGKPSTSAAKVNTATRSNGHVPPKVPPESRHPTTLSKRSRLPVRAGGLRGPRRVLQPGFQSNGLFPQARSPQKHKSKHYPLTSMSPQQPNHQYSPNVARFAPLAGCIHVEAPYASHPPDPRAAPPRLRLTHTTEAL